MIPQLPPVQCPVCRSTVLSHQSDSVHRHIRFECPTCREFTITTVAGRIVKDQLSERERKVLCGQLRNAFDQHKSPLDLTHENVVELVRAAPVPRNPADIMDRVLLDFARAARPFTAHVKVHADVHLALFLETPQDLFAVLEDLTNRGLIKRIEREPHQWTGTMTMPGWERVKQIETTVSSSWRAFVAMSFAEELRAAYVDGIKPALIGTGYFPVRADEIQHSEKIDDKIFAELNQVGLVVADFTFHRNGVYFECGYARGRRVPVIWTCRADEVEKAHFDTRQFNHITWTTPAELRDRLVDRIRATLPAVPVNAAAASGQT